jgi:hypothetical protein
VKIALFSSFPRDFIDRKILPELARRGLEVVVVAEAKRAPAIDLRAAGVELVLHMTELGGHSMSGAMSDMCRRQGIPIRSLSRKKSSWWFLPPPPGGITAAGRSGRAGGSEGDDHGAEGVEGDRGRAGLRGGREGAADGRQR